LGLFAFRPLVERCVAASRVRSIGSDQHVACLFGPCTTARYSCRMQANTQLGAQSICKRCRIAFHVSAKILLAMGFLRKVMLFINPGYPRAGSSISIPIKLGSRCPSRTKVRAQGKGHAAMYASGLRAPHARRCRRTKTDVCPVICRCHAGGLHSFDRVRDDVSMSSVAKPLSCAGPQRVPYAMIGSAPKESTGRSAWGHAGVISKQADGPSLENSQMIAAEWVPGW
jgi:hypothetical protein